MDISWIDICILYLKQYLAKRSKAPHYTAISVEKILQKLHSISCSKYERNAKTIFNNLKSRDIKNVGCFFKIDEMAKFKLLSLNLEMNCRYFWKKELVVGLQNKTHFLQRKLADLTKNLPTTRGKTSYSLMKLHLNFQPQL